MTHIQFKNTKNVPYYMFAAGSIAALGDLLEPRRQDGEVIFCIDHFFEGHELVNRLPIQADDRVFYIDVTEEPKTTDIDRLRDAVADQSIGCVVGVGGGATMDTAKALSNLITNGGNAEDYQGWDLVKVPGVYKIGVPTLSGTGSESSRTCVMTNEAKGLKMGMNSDFTMFDQLILDPDLTAAVPRDQYFYTGMDTYFHSMESLRGSYRNIVVDSFAEKAVALCREIFLSDDMMSPKNREKMMIASYLGGCAAGNVGIVHPISAGLSIVKHTHHGLANCYAMSVLEEFYPVMYAEFNEMMKKQGVSLPQGVCADLSQADFEQLYASSTIHEKPLTNALGQGFRDVLTKEKVFSLFERM